MIEREEIDRLAARATLLLVLILCLFGWVVHRYLDIMVLRHDEFRAVAEGQRTREVKLRAMRGTIRDRHGRVLALTRAISSVAVDPSLLALEEKETFATMAAAALELDPEFVRERLDRPVRFVWLRRRVRDKRVLERLPGLRSHRAVVVQEELTRCYPAGSVGAHLVGCAQAADPDSGAMRGASGIEQACDRMLRARQGCREVLRDGKAASLRRSRCAEQKRQDGQDIVLAMDLTIQTFVEDALEETCAEWTPERAAVVVLDPRNGDLLAMASRPGFDPNDLGTARAGSLVAVPVENGFEVGSVMKPLVAAAALDRGVVSYDAMIDCTSDGAYRLRRGRVLHDYKPMGVLSFPDVLVKSSNIGIAIVAQDLGDHELYRYIRALGFGQKTGSGLPGEAPGGGAANPRHTWRENDTLPSVAIGHEILVTPLQFATAFATLANGGYLYRPRVAVRVGDREIPPLALRKPFDSDMVRSLIVPALERVVTEGTGRNAQLEGYRVAGKTGTAEVKEGGVVVGYTSSFVGFAPAENPRFLVYVLLHRPRLDKSKPYGGTCAGPCVKRILKMCLGYSENRVADRRGAYGRVDNLR